MWPSATGAGTLASCELNSETVALDFASEVLGWRWPEVLETKDVADGRRLGLIDASPSLRGDQLEPTVEVLTRRDPQGGCWFVSRVGAPLLSTIAASVTVRDETATVGFASRAAASVEVILGQAGGEMLTATDAVHPVNLEGFHGPGYFLVFWRNENGKVYSAAGGPLPPGDFAAG
jgi:hypothetical protein